MKVPIQNIYYLFCYAWRFLPDELAIDVGASPNDDVLNLCAHVLIAGIDRLLRRGIDRGYLEFAEHTPRIRGRIDLTETITTLSWVNARAVCRFDELTPDILQNRIIRTTVRFLLNAPIEAKLRNQLAETEGRLANITTVPITSSLFHRVQIHRNNSFYAFLMRICELVHSSLVPDRSGDNPSWFRDILSDEKYMSAVFEEFVRNFYDLKQREFRVSRTHPKWVATAEKSEDLRFLPTMTTDVTLTSGHRTIIIDAKYYRDALQTNFGSRTVHSGNLYQLLTYLRNSRRETPESGSTDGILVYPVGEESVDLSYTIDGYPVRIFTLNLGQSLEQIERDLLELVMPVGNAS